MDTPKGPETKVFPTTGLNSPPHACDPTGVGAIAFALAMVMAFVLWNGAHAFFAGDTYQRWKRQLLRTRAAYMETMSNSVIGMCIAMAWMLGVKSWMPHITLYAVVPSVVAVYFWYGSDTQGAWFLIWSSLCTFPVCMSIQSPPAAWYCAVVVLLILIVSRVWDYFFPGENQPPRTRSRSSWTRRFAEFKREALKKMPILWAIVSAFAMLQCVVFILNKLGLTCATTEVFYPKWIIPLVAFAFAFLVFYKKFTRMAFAIAAEMVMFNFTNIPSRYTVYLINHSNDLFEIIHSFVETKPNYRVQCHAINSLHKIDQAMLCYTKAGIEDARIKCEQLQFMSVLSTWTVIVALVFFLIQKMK